MANDEEEQDRFDVWVAKVEKIPYVGKLLAALIWLVGGSIYWILFVAYLFLIQLPVRSFKGLRNPNSVIGTFPFDEKGDYSNTRLLFFGIVLFYFFMGLFLVWLVLFV